MPPERPRVLVVQLPFSSRLAQGLSPASCHAGDGATNVIPDTVEVGGSLRGLSELTFYHLIDRATEVSTKPSALSTAMLLGLSAALHCMS